MTGADLLVLAPWLLFAAGLAAIGYALLHRRAPGGRADGRRTRGRTAGRRARGRAAGGRARGRRVPGRRAVSHRDGRR